MASILIDLEHLHDIGMVQQPERSKLSLDKLLLRFIHLVLFDNFDCAKGLSVSVLAFAHLAKGSRANYLSDLIYLLEFSLRVHFYEVFLSDCETFFWNLFKNFLLASSLNRSLALVFVLPTLVFLPICSHTYAVLAHICCWYDSGFIN